MIKKIEKYSIIDYIFWFIFILRTNPGGILAALGEDKSKSGIDITDFLFVILFGCFLIIFQNFKINDDTFKKIVKYLIFFGLYYFIVFGYFVPVLKENPGYTYFEFFKKSRRVIYSLFLFVMVYPFFLRSGRLFFKTLLWTSILVLALFFISFVTGIEILPIEKANRGFINIDRIFLKNYGFMDLLIPMGAVLIIFKSNWKWKKVILAGFIMMFIAWVLSLTRRHILGTFVYLFLAAILFNYFNNKPLFPVKKLLYVLLFSGMIGIIISLSFPKYLEATFDGINETIYVLQYGETSTGRKDVRLGMGKDFMQNLIVENYWFGTGYDGRWGGSAGDKLGYESADYPFLSAIAMTGVLGLLVFLPIYIILIKALIFDVKFCKKHNINYQSIEFFGLILFIIYFVFHLFQYMNWFLPVSMAKGAKWYVFLAMYMASRQLFYYKLSIRDTSDKKKF